MGPFPPPSTKLEGLSYNATAGGKLANCTSHIVQLCNRVLQLNNRYVVFPIYIEQECAPVCNSVQWQWVVRQYSYNHFSLGTWSPGDLLGRGSLDFLFLLWSSRHIWSWNIWWNLVLFLPEYLNYQNTLAILFVTDHIYQTLAQAECRPGWSKDQRIVPMRSFGGHRLSLVQTWSFKL